jgi:hypothetical protein
MWYNSEDKNTVNSEPGDQANLHLAKTENQQLEYLFIRKDSSEKWLNGWIFLGIKFLQGKDS